jgi:GH25 family lysozyme M1 (1,4-beta-N-acetylmuramidase)
MIVERRIDAIDTSHFNVVDFAALPVLPAYITKATQGTTRIDPKFYAYRDAARAARIQRRIWYHFITGDDAESQARFFASVIGPLQPNEGVMLDVEPDARVVLVFSTGSTSKRQPKQSSESPTCRRWSSTSG